MSIKVVWEKHGDTPHAHDTSIVTEDWSLPPMTAPKLGIATNQSAPNLVISKYCTNTGYCHQSRCPHWLSPPITVPDTSCLRVIMATLYWEKAAWNLDLGISMKTSPIFSLLLYSLISIHCGLKKYLLFRLLVIFLIMPARDSHIFQDHRNRSELLFYFLSGWKEVVLSKVRDKDLR